MYVHTHAYTHEKEGRQNELFSIVPDIDHTPRESLTEVLHDFQVHGILQRELYPMEGVNKQK